MMRPLGIAACLLAAGCSSTSESPRSARDPIPPLFAEPISLTRRSREVLSDIGAWDAATSAERRAAAGEVAEQGPAMRLVGLKWFERGGSRHEIAVFLHAHTGLEFSLIPGGTFRMGSPPDEKGRDWDEIPRLVTITTPFLICRTEATREAWERFAPSPGWPTSPRKPATGMKGSEMLELCLAAGLGRDRNYSLYCGLPTEAQWEYACRAGTTSPWCSGDSESELDHVAWYASNNHGLRDVGLKAPNAFGLFDVHGNAHEYCGDHTPSGPAQVTDPSGSPWTSVALRGGGCGTKAEDARSAYRGASSLASYDTERGFRPSVTIRLR
jgi:formylglycine-generating enzyme